MGKESLNRILDTLEVTHLLSSRRKVLTSTELLNTIEQKDILIRVEQGVFSADQNHEIIPNGSYYLIPRGNLINFRHGAPPYKVLGSEGFSSKEEREKYLQPLNLKDLTNPLDHVFSIIGFDVLIHGAIPFFSIIDLPSLRIEKDDTINELVNKMILEEQKDLVGKSSMLNKIAFELVIHICRYIYTKRELEPYLLKLKFLSDKRLINIIQYIQDNLENELANHKIAALAYVSKDYVGQFFKSLTNHNLQDYIESRRLERAHHLLRTTTDNIQEIAHKVGFKDPAYFSRRFKMRFNQNAKEIRKSEFLLM